VIASIKAAKKGIEGWLKYDGWLDMFAAASLLQVN
jgi:hypothetical protein